MVDKFGKKQPSTYAEDDLPGSSARHSIKQSQFRQEKTALPIQKMKRLLAAVLIPARACLSVLGSMSATIPMFQWAQWHTRTFQNSFLRQWNGVSMSQPIFISNQVKQSIWWWTHIHNFKRFRNIVPPPQEVVTSDASMEGWGAHFRDQAVQGLERQGVLGYYVWTTKWQ